MTTKKIGIQAIILTVLISVSLVLTAFYLPSPKVQALEGVNKHYKLIGALSSKRNPSRSFLDSITYPLNEYNNNAMANALMRTYYLSAAQEAQLPSLLTYPANSSEQTRADLRYLHELQRQRTPDEVKRAKEIGEIGSWPTILNPLEPGYQENLAQLFYIASGVGKWYNPENFPATTQLLRNTLQDIRVTEFRLKEHFKRPRPYHLDTTIIPVMRMKTPSFASGHSLWAFSQAFLFSEIIPERRAQFVNMAEEVRWSREVLGIHFPTDNEASRIISWHLLNKWMKNPRFRKDLAKAKAEWKAKSQHFQ